MNIKLDGSFQLKDENWNEITTINVDGNSVRLGYDSKVNLMKFLLEDNNTVEMLINALLSHPKYKEKVFNATLNELVSQGETT